MSGLECTLGGSRRLGTNSISNTPTSLQNDSAAPTPAAAACTNPCRCCLHQHLLRQHLLLLLLLLLLL